MPSLVRKHWNKRACGWWLQTQTGSAAECGRAGLIAGAGQRGWSRRGSGRLVMSWGEWWVTWSSCLLSGGNREGWSWRREGVQGWPREERTLQGQDFEIVTRFRKEPRANKARKEESWKKGGALCSFPPSAGLWVLVCPTLVWGCLAGSSLCSTLPTGRLYLWFLSLRQNKSVWAGMLRARNLHGKWICLFF